MASVRLEVHGDAIDAIAQMRRRRPVVEHMTEMTAATAAMHFIAHHAVAVVGRFLDRSRLRVVEAWPPGAALKLLFRREQRLATSSTGKRAVALFKIERATAGCFGAMRAHDVVLLGREQLAPLGFGMGDRIELAAHDGYLIASGLIGEPTAPVIGIAGATNMNSYTLSAAQSSASSLRLKISPMVMPMIGMVIQCQGWLMPSSLSFGRTSQPQVSLASAANSVRLIHSSVSNAKPGASPPG